MPKLATLARVLAVNALILGGGLVVIELVFGTWFQEANALYQFTKPRNVHIVQPNPIPGEGGTITYTRDANGFRGLHAPVSEIDIITVGGSTTDQRFLDDAATFQAVMAARFAAEGRQLAIANAGIDGQSTIGHAKIFPSWFDKVPGLRSKYVLYYVGINDLMRINSGDASDEMAADRPMLRAQLYIREKSVFYQLYLIAKQLATPHPLIHKLNKENIAIRQDLVDTPTAGTAKEPEAALEQLRTRVRDIDAQTRARGAKPIFVTQRSARWIRKNGKIYGIATYRTDGPNEFSSFGPVNGVDIYGFEQRVATVVMETCRDAGSICVDLMNDIEFDFDRDFYDAVHTTASGSARIGEFLHRVLREKL